MAIKTFKKTDKTQLSDNFKVSEFACHGSGCCSTVLIDTQLVTYLQKIRDHFGKPITINSGYRCATHNKNVGGATNSRHTKGQAADISVKGVAPAEVAKYAESIGVLGIGLYETAKDGYFVHIDTRTTKSFWYGQAQSYRSTFGGSTKKTVTLEVEFQKLQKGATGEQVKFVQVLLGCSPDGRFGSATEKAVKSFQAEVGLTEDGVVGRDTWMKLIERFEAN